MIGTIRDAYEAAVRDGGERKRAGIGMPAAEVLAVLHSHSGEWYWETAMRPRSGEMYVFLTPRDHYERDGIRGDHTVRLTAPADRRTQVAYETALFGRPLKYDG